MKEIKEEEELWTDRDRWKWAQQVMNDVAQNEGN
jgi:hypothetical protein